MTHTLHRYGTYENLKHDFVVFAIAAQTVNAKGKAPFFADFYKVVSKYNPIFSGDMKTGNIQAVGQAAILDGFRDNSIVHAVFTDMETVAEVLRELAEADLGLSIVVSGILEHTDECCRKAGIQRHTVEHSLGIHGKTEKLPTASILEVSTMCGHGMIAFNLIKQMVKDIESGKKTSEAAALVLASQCHCGIVNPARAAQLLSLIAGNKT